MKVVKHPSGQVAGTIAFAHARLELVEGRILAALSQYVVGSAHGSAYCDLRRNGRKNLMHPKPKVISLESAKTCSDGLSQNSFSANRSCMPRSIITRLHEMLHMQSTSIST